MTDAPSLDDLCRAAAVFTGFAGVDDSWLRLRADTAPGLDLSRAEHRTLLLRWLNTWGCRIRYPRAGEPEPYDAGVAAWWAAWGTALPAVSLARLDDAQTDALGTAYARLAAVEVATGRARRTLGPTAAAKALYALRPDTVMPWDAAIAVRLHGARDAAAFTRHQRLGRDWARGVLTESGGDERALARTVGRPGIPLSKIIDEYLYVTITMASRPAGAPDGAGTARAAAPT